MEGYSDQEVRVASDIAGFVGSARTTGTKYLTMDEVLAKYAGRYAQVSTEASAPVPVEDEDDGMVVKRVTAATRLNGGIRLQTCGGGYRVMRQKARGAY